jgi:hypothetical protein
MVPLGYVSQDKKLFIEEEEAERVRTIFRRYLELGSLGQLLGDLRQRGIVTRPRRLSDGRTVGGIPFTRGPLAYLLRIMPKIFAAFVDVTATNCSRVMRPLPTPSENIMGG